MRYILHYTYGCFVYSITEHPRIYRKGTKQLLATTCTVTACLWLYLCIYIRQNVYYTYTLYDLRVRVLIDNRIVVLLWLLYATRVHIGKVLHPTGALYYKNHTV